MKQNDQVKAHYLKTFHERKLKAAEAAICYQAVNITRCTAKKAPAIPILQISESRTLEKNAPNNRKLINSLSWEHLVKKTKRHDLRDDLSERLTFSAKSN